MESVSDMEEQQRVPVKENQEMVQCFQNWASTVNQNPVDQGNSAVVLISILLWMMSSSQWLNHILDLQYQLLCYHIQLPLNSPTFTAAFSLPTLIPDPTPPNKWEGQSCGLQFVGSIKRIWCNSKGAVGKGVEEVCGTCK